MADCWACQKIVTDGQLALTAVIMAAIFMFVATMIFSPQTIVLSGTAVYWLTMTRQVKTNPTQIPLRSISIVSDKML